MQAGWLSADRLFALLKGAVRPIATSLRSAGLGQGRAVFRS
jgi:hypothetical protein